MKKYGIIGFGNGAGNVIAGFRKSDLYDRIAIDTDKIFLKNIEVDKKLLIGKKTCNGMGCGANTKTGRFAFNENLEEILTVTRNYEKIFVVACLGGGCSTGCAIEFANYYKNYYHIAVTMPFDYEGEKRKEQAQSAIDELNKFQIKPLIIENNDMLKTIDNKTLLKDALKIINKKIIEKIEKIIED